MPATAETKEVRDSAHGDANPTRAGGDAHAVYDLPNYYQVPKSEQTAIWHRLTPIERLEWINLSSLRIEHANAPKTVDAAVAYIISKLSADDRKRLRSTPRKDLIKYHFGLGMGIRNELGLWGANPELLKSTGKQHPDDASMVIIEAVWTALQSEAE